MFERCTRIFALSLLIIRDGIRRHALLGLVLFALAASVAGLFFIQFIPRDLGRSAADYLLSISWLAGFLFLLFHAIPAMSWESDRGLVHGCLARPISRVEYTLGIFCGLATLLFLLHILLAILNWFLLILIQKMIGPVHFPKLSAVAFLLTICGAYFSQMILMAVSLFFACAVRGSFPVLLLTLSYYGICSGLPVVREAAQENGQTAMQDSLLRLLTAIFPDFSWLDFKDLITSSNNLPGWTELAWPFLLLFLYGFLILSLAGYIFARRDIQ